MKLYMPTSRLCLLLLLLLLYISCSSRVVNLDSEEIFQIPIGLLRDEINLLWQRNLLYRNISNFAITPFGNYYIVDRNAKKILYYNNYGKINYIIYNPEYRFDSDKNSQDYLDKIWYFAEISEIAANAQRLYVASSLHNNARDSDANNQYNQLIFVFDKRGQFRYHLGLTGKGGSAFQYAITQLFVGRGGNLFAVTRHPEAHQIYVFSPSGDLLHSFALSVHKTILGDALFRSRSEQGKPGEVRFEIASPHVSVDGKKIYFELYQYAAAAGSNSSQANQQAATFRHDIYSIDVAKPYNSLKKNFAVKTSNGENLSTEQVYAEEFLGIAGNDLLAFLYTNSVGDMSVVYFDNKGRQKYAVGIDVAADVPYRLYLSTNGLLSALKFYEEYVSVVWWRTDRLFEGNVAAVTEQSP